MTDKEKIRAKIERLYVYWDGVMQSSAATEAVARKNICKELLSFIDSMQEEPVEDLVEATNNYVLNARKGYPRVMDETDRYNCNAFKAGAKWHKEQMMKEAVDMVVGYWMPNGLILDVDETENCYNIDEGDKVKVIVIKED